MARRKKKKIQPLPDINSLPPPPLPGTLPPPPELGDLPLPPPIETPDLPLPPPPSLPSEPMSNDMDDNHTEQVDDVEIEINEIDEIEIIEDIEVETNYSDLWTNRTEKSLQQMYGHIDRLGNDEVGSLLDRYADRFGHDLDREIIVKRKAEKDSVRETAPVVELISAPDNDEEDHDEDEESVETSDLEERLEQLESNMRPLKKKFDAAKAKKNKSAVSKLGKKLKPMVDERKLLKGILSGDIPESALEEFDSDDDDDEEEEQEDEFIAFFQVVNDLLGNMPEDFITEFVKTKNYKLFEKVGNNPENANESTRRKFFEMINNELGSMPEDMLDEFIASSNFSLYKRMGDIYGSSDS